MKSRIGKRTKSKSTSRTQGVIGGGVSAMVMTLLVGRVVYLLFDSAANVAQRLLTHGVGIQPRHLTWIYWTTRRKAVGGERLVRWSSRAWSFDCKSFANADLCGGMPALSHKVKRKFGVKLLVVLLYDGFC